jgi:hypothetical protein
MSLKPSTDDDARSDASVRAQFNRTYLACGGGPASSYPISAGDGQAPGDLRGDDGLGGYGKVIGAADAGVIGGVDDAGAGGAEVPSDTTDLRFHTRGSIPVDSARQSMTTTGGDPASRLMARGMPPSFDSNTDSAGGLAI